jgi:hypothetical protein
MPFSGTTPMSDSADHYPKDPKPRKIAWASPKQRSEDEPGRPMNYNANMQLILRRLADEKRTTGWRKWWKSHA